MYKNDGTYRNQQKINVTDFNQGMLTPNYAEEHWGEYKVAEPDLNRAQRASENWPAKHGETQYSFGEYEFSSRTEEEYNAVRKLQMNFDGTVATAPNVKLSKQAKGKITSAVLTGNFQLSANNKIGRVNVGSRCYLFEPFDSGGVYVYRWEKHKDINAAVMASRLGGNYERTGPEGNRRVGQDSAGARGSLPNGAKYHFVGDVGPGATDPVAGGEPKSLSAGGGIESPGIWENPALTTYSPDYAYWRNLMKEGMGEDEDAKYSFGDDYEGMNPGLACIPWADQVDLVLTRQLDNILRDRHDYRIKDPTLADKRSVLYVAKEPTHLLQQLGLSDLPSFVYDGMEGPAHFVNMYGLKKADDFIKEAIGRNGVLYVSEKMGQHPAVRGVSNGNTPSGKSLASAYNTIVRSKAPTVNNSLSPTTCGARTTKRRPRCWRTPAIPQPS